MMDWRWLLMIAGGYVLGSVPFGLLIGLSRGVDIRTAGSMNIGATNCGRVLGRRFGLICFVLDLLKGAAPVLIAGAWFDLFGADRIEPTQAWLWLAAGVAAVLGHIFSIFLRFKGGKGVATAFGVILGLWPYLTLPALGALYTWLLFAGAMRYVGLASVMAATAMPFYLLLAGSIMGWETQTIQPFMVVCVALGALLIVRHRGNLVRLVKGTENRLGERRAR